MLIKLFIIFIIIIALIISCSEKKQDSNQSTSNQKQLYFSFYENFDNFEDYFKKLSTLQPELTDSTVIGAISHIFELKDQLIIADPVSSKIMAFNSDRKLLKTITRKGNGPVEFMYLSNVFSFGDTLCVHDFHKILYFDPNGEFLGEEKMQDRFLHVNKMFFSDENRFVFCPGVKIETLYKVGKGFSILGAYAPQAEEWKEFQRDYYIDTKACDYFNGYFYISWFYSNLINVYDAQGNWVKEFSCKESKMYQSPVLPEKSEYSTSNPMDFDIRGFMNSFTWPDDIIITKDGFLLQLFYRWDDSPTGVVRSYFLHIFDIQGNLVQSDIKLPGCNLLTIQASSNKLFVCKQPEMDADGNLENPVIDIYSWNPPVPPNQ